MNEDQLDMENQPEDALSLGYVPITISSYELSVLRRKLEEARVGWRTITGVMETERSGRLAAERERDESKLKALEQSEMIQREGLSPYEKAGLEGKIQSLILELEQLREYSSTVESQRDALREELAQTRSTHIDRLLADVEHYHVAKYSGEILLRECGRCDRDLLDPIHKRGKVGE